MADQNSVIVVTPHERAVQVDGVKLKCLPEPAKDAPRVIRWDASVKNWPGFREDVHGEGRGFKDFAEVAPYLTAWEAAKATDAENKAAKEAHELGAKRRREAEHAAAVAAQEALAAKHRPVNEALTGLALSDHEVIKAMEAELVAQGKLDPKLAAERAAWRAKVKAAKGKQ